MTSLRQTEFINLLQNRRRGLAVIIEDREALGYNNYSVLNHAELINFYNPHDKCLWDAIIPGYDYKLEPGSRHLSQDIFGYINVPGGNHKIIINIKYDGFSYEKFLDDIANFMYYYKVVNDVEVSLILFKSLKNNL